MKTTATILLAIAAMTGGQLVCIKYKHELAAPDLEKQREQKHIREEQLAWRNSPEGIAAAKKAATEEREYREWEKNRWAPSTHGGTTL